MSTIIIWLDQENAKVFQFSGNTIETTKLEGHHHDHHTHAIDQLDLKRNEHAFFNKILSSLNKAKRILLIGPGLAKQHFQGFLKEHHALTADKISDCQTVSHLTDAQIIAYARQYFDMPGSDLVD